MGRSFRGTPCNDRERAFIIRTCDRKGSTIKQLVRIKMKTGAGFKLETVVFSVEKRSFNCWVR